MRSQRILHFFRSPIHWVHRAVIFATALPTCCTIHPCDGRTSVRPDRIAITYTRYSIYAVARKNRLWWTSSRQAFSSAGQCRIKVGAIDAAALGPFVKYRPAHG